MAKLAIAVLGIDLGKNTCSVAGLDVAGAVVLRRRLTREGVVKFVTELPACVVAMEACCGAHFLGRDLCLPGSHRATCRCCTGRASGWWLDEHD